MISPLEKSMVMDPQDEKEENTENMFDEMYEDKLEIN
jgi:hypothetical protein